MSGFKSANYAANTQGSIIDGAISFSQTCHQAFATKDINKKEQKLKDGTIKLKKIIGDLTIELKKNGFEY